MGVCTISGVRIAGIACAVPKDFRSSEEDEAVFGAEEVRKVLGNSGVLRRHLAGSLCTSDLCFVAASRLLESLNWQRESVDVLVVVTQTPDYLLPATSCSLHRRLGLGKGCAAFDINLGCSGYVYGLWVASNLISSGSARRVLLLAGDTISRITSSLDRSVAMLFGDGGSATALEYSPEAQPSTFALGTDGTGERELVVPAGLFRQPHTTATAQRMVRENGNIRSDEDLYMNGAEIFSFALREVPPLVRSVLDAADWTLESVDSVVMHQASRFMLFQMAKRLKIPEEKLALALADYGNTSVASIPLAMTHCLRERLQQHALRLVLVGFGVGFSWAGAALKCGPMVMPELELVNGDFAQ